MKRIHHINGDLIRDILLYFSGDTKNAETYALNSGRRSYCKLLINIGSVKGNDGKDVENVLLLLWLLLLLLLLVVVVGNKS